MIVELTAAQVEAMSSALTRCGLTWAVDRWVANWDLRRGSRSTHECLMPAVGWQQTLAALVEFSVGVRGGNRKDAATRALNARTRIAKAISMYAAHPALYDVGMVGTYNEVLPVWQRPDFPPLTMQDVRYAIYPQVDWDFVHLVPEITGAYTRWLAAPPLPLWEDWDEHPPSVLNPTEHWSFLTVRGSARPAPASPG
jgi:hypothetical protein